MEPASSIPPPPAGAVACKRHPGTQTMLRCTRCGDPICPDCMRPAAVGYQCPSCARGSRQELHPARPQQIVAAPGRGLTLTNVLLLVLGGVYCARGRRQPAPARSSRDRPPIVLVRMGASLGYARAPGTPIIGIAAGEYWRLSPAIFLHGSLLHLAMNGYALWASRQHRRGGARARRLHRHLRDRRSLRLAASYMFSDVQTSPGVGASGAIFALLGVFLAYNWRRRHNSRSTRHGCGTWRS